MSLFVEDTRAISDLSHDDINMSEEAIPSEMIKICINILHSDHMSPEEQSVRYFTRKKLKTLSTWKE